ncbi:transmembrane protein 244 isoform X3 [Neoarius graeffei]|uniref:transmembrane protein 244 isoform X3 n=1 Tax=Neoarius graeffei TaxID=443677 RepID=UPI00298C3746|nr:transmembrane protein 244 isoform X3 [Neoarius graeffei]
MALCKITLLDECVKGHRFRLKKKPRNWSRICTLKLQSATLDAKSSNFTVVLQNLFMCLVCFYSLYYIAVSLCIGILNECDFDRGDIRRGRTHIRLDRGGVGVGLRHHHHAPTCRPDGRCHGRFPFHAALVDRSRFRFTHDDLRWSDSGVSSFPE